MYAARRTSWWTALVVTASIGLVVGSGCVRTLEVGTGTGDPKVGCGTPADREPSGGAVEYAERFDTLGAGVEAADVVVSGHTRDVRITRYIREEGGEDSLFMIGVTVHPVEVLAGTLPAAHTRRLVVEFTGGSRGAEDESVQAVRRALSPGRGIWFLYALGPGDGGAGSPPGAAKGFYRLLVPDAFFTERCGSVVNPLVDGEVDPPQGIAVEGMKFDSLAKLAVHIRRLDG
jgi:hypothetical protein